MDRFKYEVAKRPNYELASAISWAMGGAGLLALNSALSQIEELNYAALPFMIGMAGYRGYQAYQQHLKNSGFSADQNIEFLKFSDLKNKKYRDDALWLGKGFAWTGDITQRLYDEFLRNPDSLQNVNVDDPNLPVGAFWMHGLGDKEKDIYKNIRDFEGHTLIPGTTGAGKTRAIDIIIAQLLLRKDEPLIMIDPKNDEDARENMRKICEKEGRKFLYFHPGFPEKSVRIDALHSWSRVTQVADRIKAVLPGDSGSDPFANIIWNVVNAIASCMVLVGERPSIISFRNYMAQDKMDDLISRSIESFAQSIEPDWKQYYAPFASRFADPKKKNVTEGSIKLASLVAFYNEFLSKKKINMDIAELINIRLHDREHFQKLIASLFPVLSMLSSGGLSDLLSPEPDPDDERPIVTTKQIVDDKCVLWMGLDTLSDQTVGAMIGSIILSDMTSVAGSRYNFGKGDTLKVNLIVDEVAEVINPPLIQMLNKARGAGFRCFLLTQTMADLTVRLGSEDHAEMVVGNINNEMVLRLKSSKTAEYFSSSLPEVMVKRMTPQYQTNVGHNPIEQFGGRYGEAMMEEYFALVPPWAYKILPNFHYIGNFTGGSLIKGRLPILQVDE
jgi:conjugal transfer pilus assembly protein TraD